MRAVFVNLHLAQGTLLNSKDIDFVMVHCMKTAVPFSFIPTLGPPPWHWLTLHAYPHMNVHIMLSSSNVYMDIDLHDWHDYWLTLNKSVQKALPYKGANCLNLSVLPLIGLFLHFIYGISTAPIQVRAFQNRFLEKVFCNIGSLFVSQSFLWPKLASIFLINFRCMSHFHQSRLFSIM